jgi:hypothetical protein
VVTLEGKSVAVEWGSHGGFKLRRSPEESPWIWSPEGVSMELSPGGVLLSGSAAVVLWRGSRKGCPLTGTLEVDPGVFSFVSP